MIDPFDPDQLERLRSAIERAREDLEPFRRTRHDLISQYVGSNYGTEESRKREVPVNMLELAASIYTMQVVGQRPRVNVITGDTGLLVASHNFELALNHLIEEIDLEDTLNLAFLDAFFLMGIVKVGNTRERLVEIEGVLHDVGQPSADIVDFDDWVHDTAERRYEQVKFSGDKYRLPHDFVMESGLYDSQALEDLMVVNRQRKDEDGNPTADVLGSRDQPVNPEVQDYVEFWDIWLPLENVVVTLDANGHGPPLRIVEWEGPERGPYHLLRLNDVPSNIVPVSPAAQLLDLQRMVNMGYRKLFRQASREKKVGFYTDEATGQKVKDSRDGDLISTDDPQAVTEVKFGGVSNELLAFMIHTGQQFSRQAGNLDVLGGLSPQAETLGQEQLLSGGANNRVARMAGRMNSFTGRILRDLGWHIWYDPLYDPPLIKPIPGSNQVMSVRFTEEDREGDFLDYNIRLEPYSLAYKSPGARLSQINQIMQTIVLPLLPMLQQEGLTLNFEALFRRYADYADLPELNEILETSQVPVDQAQTTGEPRQSPVTTRNENRRTVGGANPRGADQVMQQLLLGSSPGSQELNGAGVLTNASPAA